MIGFKRLVYFKTKVLKMSIDMSQKSIYEISQNHINSEWKEHFFKCRDDLYGISKTIQNKNDPMTPAKENIFAMFNSLNPKNIKVVIIGQEPYSGYCNNILELKDTGIAFSQHPGESISPENKNIFKEIKRCYPCFEAVNGNLDHWVRQGVFLINSSLTRNLNSNGFDHSKNNLWLSFVVSTLRYINSVNNNVPFIVWGTSAKSIFDHSGLKNAEKFISAHPSPSSTAKSKIFSSLPFIGSDHFVSVNYYLKSKKIDVIEWGDVYYGIEKPKTPTVPVHELFNNTINNTISIKKDKEYFSEDEFSDL